MGKSNKHCDRLLNCILMICAGFCISAFVHFLWLPQQILIVWVDQSNKNVFSHSFEVQKCEIQQGCTPSQSTRGESILGVFRLLVAAGIAGIIPSLSPWSHCLSSGCNLPDSHKDAALDLGPTQMTLGDYILRPLI